MTPRRSPITNWMFPISAYENKQVLCLFLFSDVGTWLSLVGHLLGVQEVAGLNPVSPPIFLLKKLTLKTNSILSAEIMAIRLSTLRDANLFFHLGSKSFKDTNSNFA
jgi:hypothetical protein